MSTRAQRARDARTLAEIALAVTDRNDVGTKPSSIWTAYERHLSPLRDQPIRLLEVGVYKGRSTAVFARYFPRALLTGVDIAAPALDFEAIPGAKFFLCDQRDTPRLHAIADERAPDGFDIIIEDASHVGEWSMQTYQALFPKLKLGGLYFVEDWGTGYMAEWGDGAAFAPPIMADSKDDYRRQINTHSYGMVGFVKSLVDDVCHSLDVEELIVERAFVTVRKRSG